MPIGRMIAMTCLLIACQVDAGRGQTAQIPPTTVDPFGPPSTFANPANPANPASPVPNAAAGGYATPGYPTYPATPAPAAPPTATLGPPTSFDAYAMPSVQGGLAPPTQLPYNYNQPPPPAWPGAAATPPPAPTPWQSYGQASGPPTGGIYPDGLPYQWQQGSYGWVGDDGTQYSWQRLLERIGFENTLLYGDDRREDLTWNRIELAATFAYPICRNIETPLFITPGFAFNFIDGPWGDPLATPRGPDLPAQLYDAYLDFSWYPRPAQWLGAELGVRTGVWSDFHNVTSDSVRILGRGLVVISTAPELDILVGVVYLDRLRIKMLPAGGLRWRPSPEWDLYLVFPNPKIRHRMSTTGTSDWYWYVAGEYGGGSWTVNRSGLDDRIDYNDIRVVWGLEWETQTNFRGHFEVGFVFDREVIFHSAMPSQVKPNETFMLRGGVDF